MAQATDYVIDNQVNPSFRSDLNTVLQAVLTENSGSTAPSNPVAHMPWMDTSTVPATFRRRNAANTSWYTAGVADTANMGFVSAANPTFTGTVIIPTAAAGTNSTIAASTAYVRNEITNHGAWTSITPLNAWASNGTFTIGYRLTRDNRIEFRGALVKSQPTSNEQVLSLPVGARPAITQQLFGKGLGYPSAIVEVNSSGVITVGWTPAAASLFIDFNWSLPLN